MKKIITIFIIPFLFFGCGGVKFYDTHPCVIVAKQTESSLPAANYPIRIAYPYDHYGIFYIWNAPNPVEAFFDKQGRIEIYIADFYHPYLAVGSTIFSLDEHVIKNGGIPLKFRYRKDSEQYQMDRELYKSLNLPENKYPEVDIVIKKAK